MKKSIMILTLCLITQFTVGQAIWTSNPLANKTHIVSGNGIFATISTLNATQNILTSTDGTNWVTRMLPINSNFNKLKFANNLFILLTSNQKILTSTDAINWNMYNCPNSNWQDVTYANGQFVAVANYSSDSVEVMTSINGINWVGRDAMSSNAWFSICYANGLFVATAIGGISYAQDTFKIMTSGDGINWTNRSVPNQTIFGSDSICYGNNTFIACGYANSNIGDLLKSTDGINWTSFSIQIGIQNYNWWDVKQIIYENNTFVLIAIQGILISTDGVNWIAPLVSGSFTPRLLSIAANNNIFIAVSDLNSSLESQFTSTLASNFFQTNKLNVSPNPTSTTLNIQSQKPIIDLKIIDITGRGTTPIFANNKVDVSNLANGIYLLEALTENGTIREKFIKN